MMDHDLIFDRGKKKVRVRVRVAVRVRVSVRVRVTAECHSCTGWHPDEVPIVAADQKHR